MNDVKRYIPGDGVSHVADMTWVDEIFARGGKPKVSPNDTIYVRASDYDVLKDENERLRAALRRMIEIYATVTTESDDHKALYKIIDLAEEALA